MQIDFELEDHGSLVGLTPKSDAAKEWMDENVATEGWMWMGDSLKVDAHYIMPLVEGIIAEGFEVDVL